MVVVRSFCFGLNIFSPFGINRQNGELWSPFAFSPPLGPYHYLPNDKINVSEDHTIESLWSSGKG
jgi:hypothetical protein